TAELKLWIDNIDRGAFREPKGSGIRVLAVLCISAKFPFSPCPYITTGLRIVKGTPVARTTFSVASLDRPYALLGLGKSSSISSLSEHDPDCAAIDETQISCLVPLTRAACAS